MVCENFYKKANIDINSKITYKKRLLKNNEFENLNSTNGNKTIE